MCPFDKQIIFRRKKRAAILLKNPDGDITGKILNSGSKRRKLRQIRSPPQSEHNLFRRKTIGIRICPHFRRLIDMGIGTKIRPVTTSILLTLVSVPVIGTAVASPLTSAMPVSYTHLDVYKRQRLRESRVAPPPQALVFYC